MATKAEKYTRFDAADYLDGIEDAAAYLQIALEESTDDPTAVPRALGVIARSRNISELARRRHHLDHRPQSHHTLGLRLTVHQVA